MQISASSFQFGIGPDEPFPDLDIQITQREKLSVYSLQKKKATPSGIAIKRQGREGNLQERRCKVLFLKERAMRSREFWKRIEVIGSLRPLLLPSLRALTSPKRLSVRVAGHPLANTSNH